MSALLRVLDCTGAGTWSGVIAGVIAGVNWVTSDSLNHPGPHVAVMGVSGSFFAPLNTAVHNSINTNVHYSVPAGNNNGNACNSSPASTWNATAVAASMSTDARATFSNFGTCVDLYAPGVSVGGPWMTSDNATMNISDTSVAAATVAGVLVLWRQQSPSSTVAQLSAALAASATPNVITGNPPGTPNLLVYNRMN